MSRACIVPFFRYEPSMRGSYKYLFRYFAKHLKLWCSKIDHLYLIDSGPGLSPDDLKILDGLTKITVYQAKPDSHWANLNTYLPKISESKFILMDSDTIFSSPDAVDEIFNQLDDYDVVSMTDGSGGVDLFETYSEFAANSNRGSRRRFAPYLFGCRTEFFKKIGDFDFTPITGAKWTDSMGTITNQLLEQKPRFLELPDDSTTIYYLDGGKHMSWGNLDGSGGSWCEDGPTDYGYYHVRNFNGGLYLLATKALHSAAYINAISIMPQQEALRLLGWLWIISGNAEYQNEILGVAMDFKVSAEDFYKYMEAFTAYHLWV